MCWHHLISLFLVLHDIYNSSYSFNHSYSSGLRNIRMYSFYLTGFPASLCPSFTLCLPNAYQSPLLYELKLSSSHMSEIFRCLLFCAYLISHNMMSCSSPVLWQVAGVCFLQLKPTSLCVHHIFSVHSSADKYLGWFHTLASDNNAVINTWRQASLQLPISFPSALCSEMGLFDHVLVLVLCFWGDSTLFCVTTVLIHIPTNCVQEFSFFWFFDSIL